MPSQAQRRAGGIGVAFTLALVLFDRLRPPEIALVCSGISLAVAFAFSDWPLNRGLTVAERIGRWGALILCCASFGVLVGWHFWPDWKLTDEQQSVLAEMAKETPKDMVLLVELPTGDKLGQDYGEQIRKVFQDNGSKVNKIRVMHGLGPDPEGMLVIAPQEPLDGSRCASYRYGVALALQMSQHGMPTILTYDTSGVKVVDCSSLEIWVGKKPKE